MKHGRLPDHQARITAEDHLMERTQIFDLMGELRLYGMKAAFDDIMATVQTRSSFAHACQLPRE
jgi:hypothetical protein